MSRCSRRHLFRQAGSAGKRIVGLERPMGAAPPQAERNARADLTAIAGDFPPELLALEAQRLGLDPDQTDRDTLLAAVSRAMAAGGRPGE